MIKEILSNKKSDADKWKIWIYFLIFFLHNQTQGVTTFIGKSYFSDICSLDPVTLLGKWTLWRPTDTLYQRWLCIFNRTYIKRDFVYFIILTGSLSLWTGAQDMNIDHLFKSDRRLVVENGILKRIQQALRLEAKDTMHLWIDHKGVFFLEIYVASYRWYLTIAHLKDKEECLSIRAFFIF